MSATLWFYVGGDCAACKNMNGWHHEKPSRPHPNCKCVITSVKVNGTYETRNIQEIRTPYIRTYDEFIVVNNSDSPIKSPEEVIKVVIGQYWNYKEGHKPPDKEKAEDGDADVVEIPIPSQTVPPKSVLHAVVEVHCTKVSTYGDVYLVFDAPQGADVAQPLEMFIRRVLLGEEDIEHDIQVVYK